MLANYTANTAATFDWIDITDPRKEELQAIAQQYGLEEESVNDCLQPGHLPKYERFKTYTFVILRIYAQGEINKADTIQEVTTKIAVFLTGKYLITIHRRPQPLLERIGRELAADPDDCTPKQAFLDIVMAALRTYDDLSHDLAQTMENYEKQVFLSEGNVSLLKGLYFVKRKINVIRRVLLLTQDIVDKVDPPDSSDPRTRDARDLHVKQKNIYDVLSDNSNHLLNIYFNIQSQRTNETMRVLTIFSVFFMPLTFIVGVYGMNFKFMPELSWTFGYPAAWLAMIVVTLIIYAWFKKNKWL